MVYDGRVIYDHDAFGRVVQIREVLKEITFGADGSIAMPGDADTGRLIAHYSYDALGRVIRTQRPVGAASGSTGERLAITDLYYDGVRVVQEAGWASVPAVPVPVTPGGTAYLPRPARHIAGDGELTTLPSGQGEGCSPPTPAIGWNWSDRRLQREYLWHTDPGAYVDDCVAQLVYTQAHAWNGIDDAGHDTTATVLYTLADHHATVIALTDAIGRVVAHHVISFYKTTARRMKDIEKQYQFTFDLHSVNNMVGLKPAQHRGRHTMEYHNRVFKAIETTLREHQPPVLGDAAKRVFSDELRRIAADISANPAKWFGP